MPEPRQPPAPAGSARPNARYIAALVGAAALVLLVGALLRPKAESAPAIPANELVVLPEHTRRKTMADIAAYLGERTAAVAGSVVYLAALGTSGLVLGPDSVVSASPSDGSSGSASDESDGTATTPVFLIRSAGGVLPAKAGDTLPLDTLPPRWVTVIARTADRRQLMLAGLTGGVVPLRCGELALRELVFNTTVPPAFAGGGVFDLDGNALALAVPCDRRIALVPLPEVRRALDRQRTVNYRLWMRFGFRVAPADSLGQAVPGAGAPADSDQVATDVRIGGPADRAGLAPGDILRGGLAALLDAPVGQLVVRRTAGTVTLATAVAGGSAPSTRPAGAGVVLTEVAAGSRAARAGLQPGDRVVAIGGNRRPTLATVQRAWRDSVPVFVVYERRARRRGVVLR